jgi:putative transposase
VKIALNVSRDIRRGRLLIMPPVRSHPGCLQVDNPLIPLCSFSEPPLSDGLEFTCWNGEIVRAAFIIDAHDCEVIAWRAVATAGISGSDVRDIMLEAVEARFGGARAMALVEMLTDNGSAYTARETRIFSRQLGLKPCFTPVRSPQSNGISEAFVHTLKRDYVRVSPLPDAHTALTSLADWIEDYNEHHPHSGLKMRSLREHRAMGSTTA